MCFKCSLYFTTLFVFIDWNVRDEALEIEANDFFKEITQTKINKFATMIRGGDFIKGSNTTSVYES